VEEFLILIVEKEWDYETVTEADWEREAKAHRAFAQAVRDAGGDVVESNALKGNAHAVRVRPSTSGGAAVFTDGPFTESKEVVSGYYLITARDLEQAKQLTALCPTGGFLELHPIMDVSDVM
jgi:hypothetical protein